MALRDAIGFLADTHTRAMRFGQNYFSNEMGMSYGDQRYTLNREATKFIQEMSALETHMVVHVAGVMKDHFGIDPKSETKLSEDQIEYLAGEALVFLSANVPDIIYGDDGKTSVVVQIAKYGVKEPDTPSFKRNLADYVEFDRERFYSSLRNNMFDFFRKEYALFD